MSDEHLSFSQQGLVHLKHEEGVIEGVYNDASNFCTSGVGHLVHKKDRWPSFLLDAVSQNASWKRLPAQSGRTRYLPQATAFDPQFSDIKSAATELAKGIIAKKKLGLDYAALAPTAAADVAAIATAAIETEAAALSQQVDVALRADIGPFERAILQHITVALSEQEFDALVSFAFNVGAGAFAGSTLVKKINTEKHLSGSAQERRPAIEAIQNEFAKWNKSLGRVLPGLVTRRAAEADRFLSRARNALAAPGQPR